MMYAIIRRLAILFPYKADVVYVLHLADETYYVGLSKDVTERYRQHLIRFSDIVSLSFKRMRQDVALLRAEEKQIIYHLDSYDIPLHNHVHNTISYGSSSFDLHMAPSEQRSWLETGIQARDDQRDAGMVTTTDKGERDRRKKGERDKRKMEDFQHLPERNQIADILKTYIMSTIPAYVRTQGRFWSMSCLPSTLGGFRAAAISMSYMEAFVIFRNGTCFVNIASSIFDQHYSDHTVFLEAHPDTEITVAGYEAAGFD